VTSCRVRKVVQTGHEEGTTLPKPLKSTYPKLGKMEDMGGLHQDSPGLREKLARATKLCWGEEGCGGKEGLLVIGWVGRISKLTPPN